MILPSKHTISDRSAVVLGGVILSDLQEPKELGAIWNTVRDQGSVASFERFYGSVLFLYSIGAIELEDGLLKRVGQE